MCGRPLHCKEILTYLIAPSVGCGHVSGLFMRLIAAGPDEVRGSGLNQSSAVFNRMLRHEVSRPTVRPIGINQVSFTLANLCVISFGCFCSVTVAFSIRHGRPPVGFFPSVGRRNLPGH